jgi:hypothetical protein
MGLHVCTCVPHAQLSNATPRRPSCHARLLDSVPLTFGGNLIDGYVLKMNLTLLLVQCTPLTGCALSPQTPQ